MTDPAPIGADAQPVDATPPEMDAMDTSVLAAPAADGMPRREGPPPATDRVVRWRCIDLRAEVARRFSVEVHESTIGKWLHQLGLTRLQPRPVHPKKDADAETTFKKTLPAWSTQRC